MSNPTPVSTGFKYSDAADVITISAAGLLTLSATNILISRPDVQAALGIVAFLSATIGRFLQSKGD